MDQILRPLYEKFGTAETHFILTLVLLPIYLSPSIIALRRKRMNRYAIVAVNILSGWSIVGWAIALAWSLTQPPTVVSDKGNIELLKSQSRRRLVWRNILGGLLTWLFVCLAIYKFDPELSRWYMWFVWGFWILAMCCTSGVFVIAYFCSGRRRFRSTALGSKLQILRPKHLSRKRPAPVYSTLLG
ncbi:MAG: superinfection immunity protein [Planctomycetota bacterium]